MTLKLIGKKKGMTRRYNEVGDAIPCTIISIEPNVISQVKSVEKDGYDAIQVASLKLTSSQKKNFKKPQLKFFEKNNIEPRKKCIESRVSSTEEYAVGQEISADFFSTEELVDVTGMSKGKGYQGVMKRHNFKGGPAAHGSGFHRLQGSTGALTPTRTWKRVKSAGHMGYEKVTVERLKVVEVDVENQWLLVRGSVPGAVDSVVTIRKAVKQ